MIPPPSIPARTMLGGRYVVGRRLAVGGMGEIYLARDERLCRPVVIKVPAAHLYEKPGLRERLLAESEEMKSINHPHVVPIRDVGAHGSVPYLVLPYLEGGSLETRRRGWPDEKMPPEAVLSWLQGVPGALDFLHTERRLVHRDVKPANILFDAAGRAYLSDFGIARSLSDESELVEDVSLFGSPAYMAPEQIVHGTLTGAADQYSLAVVVYHCLSGRLPHEGGSPREIMLKKQGKTPPVPITDHMPELAPGAARAIMLALERNYQARHEDCRTFAAAFRTGLSERVVLTPIETLAPIASPAPVEIRVPGRRRGPVGVPRWKSVTEKAVVVAMLLIAALLGRSVARSQHEALKPESVPGGGRAPKAASTKPAIPEILIRTPPPRAIVNPERLRLLGRVKGHFEHSTLHVLGKAVPIVDGRFDQTLSLEGVPPGPLRLTFVYEYGIYKVGDLGRINRARDVIADADPPVLWVESVPEQDDRGRCFVTGAIEEEHFASLTIDGSPVEPAEDGSFRHRIEVGEAGWIQVRFVARDGAENETELIRTFVRGGVHLQIGSPRNGAHIGTPVLVVAARVKAPRIGARIVLTILYRSGPKDTPTALTTTDLSIGLGGLVEGTIGLGDDGRYIARLELTTPDASVVAVKNLMFVLDTTRPYFSDVEVVSGSDGNHRVSSRVRDENPMWITVNGRPTPIGEDGSFRAEGPLVNGVFMLETRDKAGNTALKRAAPR